MSELILVRHGQASFGADSYDKLSPVGLRQAQILSQHWQALGEQFDACYAGTLIRQQETAAALQPLVKSESTVIHAGFNEYNGDPLLRIYLRDHAIHEGFPAGLALPIKDRKAFQLVLEAATQHWINGTLQADSGDADFESWKDFQARVHGTLDELMQLHTGGARVLISTSGGVIALALQRALNLPDNRVIEANWMVHNSSVTRLVYGRGKVSLGCFNALPHLETPGLRELITFR
ncbi:MAG: histidine phosphatase family protein [Pseudohongiella sp.]|nr:histidine phosphatase family protein [Pseudohongiella sp.]MDP2126157.1 histidine phosphatase family protein [Pseudohongiella sp.]